MGTMTVDMARQPCPDRIVEDAGGAFGMVAVCGSAYYFFKGLYSSPNGHRLGGATVVRMNAPRVGGNFTIWCCLYSTFDCALVYARRKEDPWNSIASGAATGGLLAGACSPPTRPPPAAPPSSRSSRAPGSSTSRRWKATLDFERPGEEQ
ncbi:unnamed protein product [Urochloa humidicola]